MATMPAVGEASLLRDTHDKRERRHAPEHEDGGRAVGVPTRSPLPPSIRRLATKTTAVGPPTTAAWIKHDPGSRGRQEQVPNYLGKRHKYLTVCIPGPRSTTRSTR